MVQQPTGQTPRNTTQHKQTKSTTGQRILRGRLGTRKRAVQTPLLGKLSRPGDPGISRIPSLLMSNPGIGNQTLFTDNWPASLTYH